LEEAEDPYQMERVREYEESMLKVPLSSIPLHSEDSLNIIFSYPVDVYDEIVMEEEIQAKATALAP